MIKFNNAYYFIANPFFDFEAKLYDIDIIRYGQDRRFHSAQFECTDYKPQSVISDSNEKFINNNLNELISTVRAQAETAISCSRRGILYSSEDERGTVSEYSLLGSTCYGGESKDIYIRFNYNNDGNWETIVKGHNADYSGKYYFDITRVDIFDSKEEAAAATPVIMSDISSFNYGRISIGNIFDVLPIDRSIVQFWVTEYDRKKYTMAITRRDTTYTLYVFYVKGNEVTTVHRELFLDEFNGIKVTFN